MIGLTSGHHPNRLGVFAVRRVAGLSFSQLTISGKPTRLGKWTQVLAGVNPFPVGHVCSRRGSWQNLPYPLHLEQKVRLNRVSEEDPAGGPPHAFHRTKLGQGSSAANQLFGDPGQNKMHQPLLSGDRKLQIFLLKVLGNYQQISSLPVPAVMAGCLLVP